MVEDSNPAQDMIDITGHVVHEAVSYDKDVLEIKLPDTVVTSGYGSNFVKDVCIDEGVFPHRKISEEKMLDEKPSPNFDFLMIDSNSDLYEGKGDAGKSAHELKLETVLLPVGLAADGNTEKQSSAGYFAGDTEKKISLKELLKLESAEEAQHKLELENTEESQHKSTVSSELSEDHMPPLRGEAVGQVSINKCHDVATESKTDELITSGVSSNDNASDPSSKISDRPDATAALDKPISTVEITDNLSGSREFDEVGIAEARPDALTSSTSDVQPSAKITDQCESVPREAIIDALDETAVATSSSPHVVESGDANREETNDKSSDNDGATDVHDCNQADKENCADTTNDSKISNVQKHSTHVGEQEVPDNAKGKSRIENGYPLEPCSFGPSIMCNPVSTSGHIAYSGNVSVRSDSSTTSTRSFAFPVLQMDWTSSPVRMAKAERRRTRQRHGWRRGLLCWNF